MAIHLHKRKAQCGLLLTVALLLVGCDFTDFIPGAALPTVPPPTQTTLLPYPTPIAATLMPTPAVVQLDPARLSLLRELKTLKIDAPSADVNEIVSNLAFSSDGQTIAAATSGRTIMMWNVLDGKVVNEVKGTSYQINSISFSPDLHTIAATDEGGGTAGLWRVSDGSFIRTLFSPTWVDRTDPASPHFAWVLTYSHDGQAVAVGLGNGQVELVQASDGKVLRTLQGKWDAKDSSIDQMVFSPDGKTLAVGTYLPERAVGLWRIDDGQLLGTFGGHSDEVSSIAFSPDGQTLATGDLAGTARLWRVADGTLLHSMEANPSKDKHAVTASVAFSPDGQILACGHPYGIEMWQVLDGAPIQTSLPPLQSNRLAFGGRIAFSPDGQILAYDNQENNILLWGLP